MSKIFTENEGIIVKYSSLNRDIKAKKSSPTGGKILLYFFLSQPLLDYKTQGIK